MIYVDDRSSGAHGIARFSREVVSRLSADVRRLPVRGSATAPLDCLRPGRLRPSSRDVVYVPGPNAGVARAVQLLTVHDLIHLQEGSRLKTLYYERVVAPRILRAGKVLTVSDTSRAAISAWLGRRAGRVEIDVVGNGCSEAFTPSGEAEVFDRATLAMVSNAKAHKNVGVVFAALARCPDLALVVVGPSPTEMRRLAVDAGVAERVEVRSGLTDHQLARLYRGADGLVMPSRQEGFGLPVLEAMSCGTRAVHWAHCASVAEIADGTGVAVDEAADAGEWAVGMEKVVAERVPLRLPASWAARHDWDTVGARVRRALDELT
jgi:glycosyltransferase involved in cell wall biosynthesis